MVTVSCKVCDKTFSVSVSRKNTAKFCSKKCKNNKNISINYLIKFVRVDEKTNCWIWDKTKDFDGYGVLKHRNKYFKIHRFFFEFFKGKIPISYSVLHSCDNRSCCNPDHLFLGNQIDNVNDMVSKKRNRGAKGEGNKCSKLKNENIDEIRRLYSLGISYKKISLMFGVNSSTIGKVIRRENWKHV